MVTLQIKSLKKLNSKFSETHHGNITDMLNSKFSETHRG